MIALFLILLYIHTTQIQNYKKYKMKKLVSTPSSSSSRSTSLSNCGRSHSCFCCVAAVPQSLQQKWQLCQKVYRLNMIVIMGIYYAIKVLTSLNIYLVKPNMRGSLCLLHTIQPTNHYYLSQVSYGTVGEISTGGSENW